MFRQITRTFLLFIFLPMSLWTQSEELPLPQNPNLRIGHLNNGITYYIQQHEEAFNDGTQSHRAELRLVVPVGSVREEDHEQGAAHFIEHLMFRGTKHFSEQDIEKFFSSIDVKMGADANAFTSFDQTVYKLNIPTTHSSNLEVAMLLFGEWLTNASLREADVEEERNIIIEEWRRSLGHKARETEFLCQALTRGSPYADRMPIGKENIIRNITTKQLRAFYEKWYHTAPVAIVVVGAINLDETEAMIKRVLSTIKRGPISAPAEISIPLTNDTRIEIFSSPETHKPRINFFFPKPYQPSVTMSDLRQEVASELFQYLFQARLDAIDNLPFDHASIDSGSIFLPQECVGIRARPLEGKFAETVETLLTELKRIQSDGFTPLEIMRAKRECQVIIEVVQNNLNKIDNDDLADECIEHFLHGDVSPDTELQCTLMTQCLELITSEELQAIAQDLNYERNCIIHLQIPSSHASTITQELVRKQLANVSHNKLAPYTDPALASQLMERSPKKGTIVSETYSASLQTTTLTLENGIEVSVKNTPYDKNQIVFSSTAYGGLSDFDEEQLPKARLATMLMQESGFGGFSPNEVQMLLSGKNASLYRHVDTFSRLLYGMSSTKDLETLLQLVHLTFTRQINSPKAFSKLQRNLLEHFSAEADPVSLFQQRCTDVATQHHYFYRPLSFEAIAQASYPEVDGLACNFFSNPTDFKMFFVGEVDQSAFRDLICTYLASIPTEGPARTDYKKLDVQFPSGTIQETIVKGSDPKSVIELTFPIHLDKISPTTMDALHAAQMLIQSEVYQLLRDKLSSTYHVHALLNFEMPLQQTGLLHINFACNPDDANVLAQMVIRQLRLLRVRGPTSDETKNIIDTMVRSDSQQLVENTYWATGFVAFSQMKWDLHELTGLKKRHQLLSPAAIKEALQQMLPMNNYTLMILKPEKTIN